MRVEAETNVLNNHVQEYKLCSKWELQQSPKIRVGYLKEFSAWKKSSIKIVSSQGKLHNQHHLGSEWLFKKKVSFSWIVYVVYNLLNSMPFITANIQYGRLMDLKVSKISTEIQTWSFSPDPAYIVKVWKEWKPSVQNMFEDGKSSSLLARLHVWSGKVVCDGLEAL